VTFNHGVEGSSPSALTNEINYLVRSPRSSKIPGVCTVSAKQLRRSVWWRWGALVGEPEPNFTPEPLDPTNHPD
jgi:hypothetical protein